MKSGAGEDFAIAGVLHDVTEDTEYTLQDIKAKFGDVVAVLVDGASEPEEVTKGVSREEKKKTWKLRKSQKIEKMKESFKGIETPSLRGQACKSPGISWQTIVPWVMQCGPGLMQPKKRKAGTIMAWLKLW